MIIIEGWIRFGAGEIERLRDTAKTMIAETHKEAGCLEYAFAQDLVHPGACASASAGSMTPP